MHTRVLVHSDLDQLYTLQQCHHFRWCYRCALDLANKHERLRELLGAPISSGPWYDASVRLTHGGQVVSCSFRLDGREKSSDVHIAVRGDAGDW